MSGDIRRLADASAPSRRERYGLALLATAAGCVISAGLLEVSSDPNYAPIAGAVLLSAWFGGVGPAEFYAKTVGAVAIEGSTPGIYG